MKRHNLFYSITYCVCALLLLGSCKKENGINNETIIQKPYGLYAGDFEGVIIQSNDGDFYNLIFSAESYPTRALATSKNGVLFIKENLHVSNNNGRNFNPRYTDVPVTPSPWPTMLHSAWDQQRVYVASTAGRGIFFSDDDGKTWIEDQKWDDGLIGTDIQSFSQLSNGIMFAYGNDNDSLYRKDNKDDNWTVTFGTPLPANGTYYLSNYNNALIATDYTGVNGVHYSLDSGKNWSKYSGLPTVPLYATVAPNGGELLVGTDSMGVYRLQGMQFFAANNGLLDETTVYGITGKEDIYKNGESKKYVFLATSTGIYKSEDGGRNWTMAKEGHYRVIY